MIYSPRGEELIRRRGVARIERVLVHADRRKKLIFAEDPGPLDNDLASDGSSRREGPRWRGAINLKRMLDAGYAEARSRPERICGVTDDA